MSQRSSLRVRLDQGDLEGAPTAGLERLARFLGIEVRRRMESERAYRVRLAHAIQRWEKRYQRGSIK